MALYSIYADSEHYRTIEFDSDQMFDYFGSVNNHFSVNYAPKVFLSLKRPLSVNFQCENTESHGDAMPDISEHYGRLFLSQKAYDVLGDLLKNDGEFLPVTYEDGKAYIFNTLSVAESVDGVNTDLSVKDKYGERKHMAFHEDRIKDFKIFKTKFDGYINAFIQPLIKEACGIHAEAFSSASFFLSSTAPIEKTLPIINIEVNDESLETHNERTKRIVEQGITMAKLRQSFLDVHQRTAPLISQS